MLHNDCSVFAAYQCSEPYDITVAYSSRATPYFGIAPLPCPSKGTAAITGTIMDYDDDMDVERGHDAGPADQASPNAKDAKGKQQRRVLTKRAPRPKLTLELLKQPQGFPDVFNNFPKYFADGFKGKGHEVRDLRRLLELYQRWAYRIFPTAPFDEVVEKLEKMSGSMQLRAEMRELRQGLQRIVDGDAEQPEEQEQQAGDDQQGPDAKMGHGHADDRAQDGAGAGNAQGTGTGVAAEDPDDEELLQLQQETEWDAIMDDMQDMHHMHAKAPEGCAENDVPAQRQAAAPVQATRPQHVATGPPMDEDEMLHDELLDDLMAAAHGSDAPTGPLPQPPMNQPRQQPQQQPQQQQDEDDDDDVDDAELLELAAAPTQVPGGGEGWLFAAAPPARSTPAAGLSNSSQDRPSQRAANGTAAAAATAATGAGAGPSRQQAPNSPGGNEDSDDDDELLNLVARKKRPRGRIHSGSSSSSSEEEGGGTHMGRRGRLARKVQVQGLESDDESGGSAGGRGGGGSRLMQRGQDSAGGQGTQAANTAAAAAAAAAAATAAAEDSDDELLALAQSAPCGEEQQLQGQGVAAETVLPSLALELGTEALGGSQ